MYRGSFEEMEQGLRQSGSYIIYGAGVVAYQTYAAVQELYGVPADCFVVTELSGMEETLAGVLICTPDMLAPSNWEKPILVATPEIYHEEIAQKLRQYGVREIFFVDTHMEYELMSRYFRKTGGFALLEDVPAARKCDDAGIEKLFSVYMARSHKDVALRKNYEIPLWITPMQAGRACTDTELGIATDNTGENISLKNPNYCELTVSYWTWKNNKNRYKGICHYRRIFALAGL